MKVTFIPIDDSGVAGAPFLIASGGKESPNDFRVSGTRDVQTAKYLRGTKAKAFNRGNRQVTVTFSVTRLHASESQAERYVLLHEGELPGGGTVRFTSEDGSAVLVMEDSVLTANESSYKGATTTHTYQIIGGVVENRR